VALLEERLAPTVICESLEVGPASDLSAALRGLHRLASEGSAARLLKLEARSSESTAALARRAPRKWAIAGAILLLGLITLPYLEAFLLYPRLAGRVQQVKANRSRMEIIDREADFLRFVKQTQAPYLDTLYVVGNCTPPGAHVDSFSLNRKGEMSLRISVRQPPEVTAFRTKLVDSGFFSSLVIEEQAPSQDRQKISVRISGQLKPPAERQGLAILSTNAPAPADSPTSPMPGGAPVPGTRPPPGGGPPAPADRPRAVSLLCPCALNDRERRQSVGSIRLSIYLVLFFGLKVWNFADRKRSQYRAALAEATALNERLRVYDDKVAVSKALMEQFQMDPAKLSRTTLVAQASAAIQQSAMQGGVQLGPVRESASRGGAARELTSIQIEATGPPPQILAFLASLGGLGIPLVIDSIQMTPGPMGPAPVVSLTLLILDFDQWKATSGGPMS
jgi:hypothetical protein